MTDFWSDELSSDYQTAPLESHYGGYGSSVKDNIRRGRVTLAVSGESVVESGDQVVFMKISSGDRMNGIWFSADGNVPATSTAKIGLFEVGVLGAVGSEVDDALFETDAALSSAINRVEQYLHANIMDDWDRGKPMWEIAAMGDASYTKDPQLQFYIVLTFTADPGAIVTASELQIEARFDSIE